jgi:hypothetical protein
MTPRLLAALETALEGVVQQVEKDASVLVQFAAGHFHELVDAFREAKQVSVPPPPPPPNPPAVPSSNGAAPDVVQGTTTAGEQPPAA